MTRGIIIVYKASKGEIMAILFFDGFDRYTILKDFDTNYWSVEPVSVPEYKKYAFGGYSYNHNANSYSAGQLFGDDSFSEFNAGFYSFFSPNGASLPSGIFRENYIDQFNGISGNSYPGFGSPLGFLSLHNLDISDPNLVSPITYIQLSGFSSPMFEQSFLSARILGIETKDTSYQNNDKPGRFGNKHPLIAFCSGNTTGLLLNIVKITGNNLSLIENQKMTIGLEVFQNNGISGIFDLNISEDLSQYRIRSVYSNVPGFGSGQLQGRILCIDKNLSETTEFSSSTPISPISRWCHFQFGIIQTGDMSYIQVKLDDIDLLSIPFDSSIDDKDLWDDKIYINSLNYNNIRFFNRTYNKSFIFDTNTTQNMALSRYYLYGAVTLLDDVVLSDGSGIPNTFLGANTKVIPFTPGISGNITNDGGLLDGLNEWTSNVSSTRLAFKNLDGDNGKIGTFTSGAISAVRYSNTNINLPDSNSLFRLKTEDAIGGIKVYSQAKKEFLDSSYEIILRTGVSDFFSRFNKLVLNFEETSSQGNVIDLSPNRYIFSKSVPEMQLSVDSKFGNSSLRVSGNHYLINNQSLQLNNFQSFGSPQKINFTLECWFKMVENETITLLSKNFDVSNDNTAKFYNLVISTGGLSYNRLIKSFLSIYTGQLFLTFPNNGIIDTDWHHIALVSDNTKLVVFLDGISGTSYSISSNLTNLFGSNGFNNNRLYPWSTDSRLFETDNNFTYISGNGFIDDFRITETVRYDENFVPPEAIRTERDDYIRLGDPQTMTRTKYTKVNQFYEYYHPITKEPWSTGLLANPSGFILGVKKL
jgi:hypothetical protein